MLRRMLRRRWLVPLAAVGLLLIAILPVALLTTAPQPQAFPPETASQPAPQAASSAPEPTLVALATLEPTPDATSEASPFAGIAQPPPQPPQRPSAVHHTVTEGEVLWQIAEQYNLRPETILWANDIKDADLLLIGQDLLIPPADGVLYTVRPGDQLSEVASRYGVDFQAVVSANQLEDPDAIIAGVDLFL